MLSYRIYRDGYICNAVRDPGITRGELGSH
jgi:hypothetical protein